MELFERIRYLCEIKEISQTKLAKKLNLPQTTFHHWLKASSQKNLWEYLPGILEIFQDVRPEWLYMDQEPIFKKDEPAKNDILEARVEALEKEIKNLQTQLFVETSSDQDEWTGSDKASAGQE